MVPLFTNSSWPMSETQSTLSCDSQTLITSAKTTLTTQAQALMGLADRVDTQFSQAVTMMLNTKGRVIICGMGKSGIIGKKIAATLASTALHLFLCTQVKRTTVI